MPSFKPVSLFGGSITTEFPDTFIDVSDIRQIPDHQEVYIDSQGFTSIVVEILEYVDKPDPEALKYHLDDIAEADVSSTKIITRSEARFAKLSYDTPAFTLLALAPPDEKQRSRPNEPAFVAIYLTLLRLEAKKTDLLVVINVPFIKDKYDAASVDQDAGQLGSLGDSASQMRDRILSTFEIEDWSLFGAEA